MIQIKINLLIKISFLFVGLLTFGTAFGQTKPKVDLEYDFSVGSYSGTLNYFRKDIVIPGMELAPEISFAYSGARIKNDVGYGNGWVFNYSVSYKIDTLNNVVIYKNDGSQNVFTKTDDGYIAPLSARYDVLEEYEANKFRLKQKSTDLYYYFDNNLHRRITAIENLNGLRTELTYVDSLPVLIKDAAQRKITLKWNAGHLVSVVEANTGVTRVFNYTYDQNGNLTQVTDPLKNILRYAYDAENRLIFFSDKKGNPLKIEYKSDEVVKKVSTCMHDVSFTYDVTNRKTFVLEKVGQEKVITTYHFDEQGRNVERKGNCCGFNVKLKYDNNNNVIEQTDGNNSSIKYTYDANGNLTKETNASAGEVKFIFDPKTNKLTSKTDELGNTTTYKYDHKGNRIEVNYPLNVQERYEYNENGLMTKHIDKNGLATSYFYDQYWYLNSITFPDGSVVTYENDALGNLLKETDSNQNTTSYEYDLLNRPVKKTDAVGGESIVEYDANGNIIKETNELGYSIIREYDPLNRLVHTTSAEGIETFIEYDNRGYIVGKIDGKGNKTTYTYNDMGLVTSETDALGYTLYHEYDGAGRKLQESDKMGNTMTYQYNTNGELIRKTDPVGNSMSYAYNANGRVIAETDGNGNTTSYHYDALNRKIKEIDPMGYEKVFTYDNMNNLTRIVDKNGSVTTYTYDKRYRNTHIQKPLGVVISFTYDAAGNMLSQTTAPGITDTYTYDKLNRETERIFSNGEKEAKTYDALGRLITHTFSNGNVAKYEYDKDNRVIKTSDNVGIMSVKTYDKNSNITKIIDSDGKTRLFEYDALNRTVKKVSPSGTEVLEYNPNGLPVKRTNSALESQLFTYNALGLVTKVIDYDGSVTSYAHDAMGNVLSMTDAIGNSSEFSYNKLNKLISTVYADGTKLEYEVDALGNVIRKKTAEHTIEYKYDSLGRMTSKVLPGNLTSTFVYDIRSRMVEAENENGTINFTFDDRNRLLKEKVNGKEEISYSYDLENRTKTIIYPGGRKIVEELDFIDRPTNVTQNGSQIASVTLTGMRLGSIKFGNNVSTNYTYTPTGRIQNISINSGTLFNYTYEYDNKNNVTIKEASHHPEFSEVYAYNTANQLVFYKKGEIVQQDIPTAIDQADYNYDALGNYVTKSRNGISQDFKSNNVNQYLSFTTGNTTTTLSYSASGNLTKMGNTSYQYDGEGRLTKVGSNITYKYDALGRRFQKITDAGSTTYFYYEDQLAVEQESSGAITEYIYSGGSGPLIAAIKDGATYYYHNNEIGSIIGITDDNGDVIEQYEYDPYGNVTIYNGDFEELQTSSIGNHILFTGRELDVESGFYYMRSRHYSPFLGRFIQRDPISYDGGTHNLYEYVSSNPVNFIDPFGLKKCNTNSYNWTAKIGRYSAGSNLTPVALKTSIGFNIETTTCEVCCSDNTKGSKVETKAQAFGSIGFSINALNFFPIGRILVVGFSKIKMELFAGGRASFKLTGGYSKTSNCGKISGGGGVSFEVEVAAELSLTRKEGDQGKDAELETPTGFYAQAFGIAKHTAISNANIRYTNDGEEKECDSVYKTEVSYGVHISYTWYGIQYRKSFSDAYKHTRYGALCPPGL